MAQAATTTQQQFDGRFTLDLGSGEALNCGPTRTPPGSHLGLRHAGYDEIQILQIGPDQEGMLPATTSGRSLPHFQ